MKLKSGSCPENLGRFKKVFTLEMECKLVMHVVEMQQHFYGLILRLTYAHWHMNLLREMAPNTHFRPMRDELAGTGQ